MNQSRPSPCLTTTGVAYVDMGGEGPVLVLLHGVGLDHTMWADLLPHLGTDWRIILIDMPGHGGSASPPADAQLDYYAARVVEVLDAANIDRAVLAGFSMGALVARCFALRHPERLDALVLMNGVFDRTEEVRANIVARVGQVIEGGVAATSEAALDRWFTPAWRSGHEDVVDQVRQRLNSNDEQGYVITYRLFATQDNYGAELLRTIAVPTLVITGEYDVGSTPDMTRALASRIPGAKAVVVPGARHMMWVEMPDIAAAPLVAFLDPLRAKMDTLAGNPDFREISR